MNRAIPLLLVTCVLGGCAATRSAPGGGPASAGNLPAPNLHRGTGTTRPQAGGDAVIGRDAATLVRQFGMPRLDHTEGAAHKLQFASNACVLDAYLYPPRPGAEPVVTHVDTRSPQGDDVDRATCVAALQRR